MLLQGECRQPELISQSVELTPIGDIAVPTHYFHLRGSLLASRQVNQSISDFSRQI